MVSLAGILATQTKAFADPSVIYLAVGSDTIQDVTNQFGLDFAGNLLGSFNATNPVTNAVHEVVTAAKTGTTSPVVAPAQCSFDRPNGSGEGVSALRLSMGSTTASPPGGANPPQATCIDIGRSSSAPGAANVDPTAGKLIYIPFALDAVTGATGSVAGTINGTATPASALNNPAFTLAQLQAMYANGTPETAANGTTYDPEAVTNGHVAAAGDLPIDLYIPQSGSGTRNFWAGQMGINATTPPAWVFDHIQTTANITNPPATNTPATFVGVQVEEHDGTAVSADPFGYGPFSIAQYIAQTAGHNDRRHQAVLQTINGVAPIVNGSLNASFPVRREVYNVVAYDRVVNTGDGAFDANLAGMLVGTASQICRDSITVHNFGFGSLATAPLGHTCGAIDTTNLRAFGATTGF
jgi:phosphate transport system substrate-binding protein